MVIDLPQALIRLRIKHRPSDGKLRILIPVKLLFKMIQRILTASQSASQMKGLHADAVPEACRFIEQQIRRRIGLIFFFGCGQMIMKLSVAIQNNGHRDCLSGKNR